MIDRYKAALAWLDRGAAVLPVQPGRKYLVEGFGPFRKRITAADEAFKWFGNGLYNLAVCLPDGLICLDFDSDECFAEWEKTVNPQLQATYQEITPRGYHLFYRVNLPIRLWLVPGIEIKRVCLVAPSVVKGRTYGRIDYPILQLDDYSPLISSLLSEPPPQAMPANLSKEKNTQGHKTDTIGRVKAAWPVYDLASTLTQLVTSDHGRGRWFKGRCPLHQDRRPSFWVDAERGLWGCHSCGVRGDVINLYARLNGLTDQEAIKVMAARLADGGNQA